MKTINLRDHFPEYELDCFVEVADGEADAFIASMTGEVAAVYFDAQRQENASMRRMYYHKAHYSLDRGDGIENEAVAFAPSPEALFMEKLGHEQLAAALAALPEPQRRRVGARFIHGMGVTEIARAEGVAKSRVSESIQRGLLNMKKYLENPL